jgi:hypothetical protein
MVVGWFKIRSNVCSNAKIFIASPAYTFHLYLQKIRDVSASPSKANKFRPFLISPSLYTTLNCFRTSSSICLKQFWISDSEINLPTNGHKVISMSHE